MDHPALPSFRFPDLQGRSLLITGITRGIGRAFLPFLFEQGMTVIALSKDEGELAAIRKEVGPDADRFHFYACDLADPGAVKQSADDLTHSGLAIDGGIVHPLASPEIQGRNL